MTSEELAETVRELVAMSDRTVAAVSQAEQAKAVATQLAQVGSQVAAAASGVVDECNALLASLQNVDAVTVANRLASVIQVLAQQEDAAKAAEEVANVGN